MSLKTNTKLRALPYVIEDEFETAQEALSYWEQNLPKNYRVVGIPMVIGTRPTIQIKDAPTKFVFRVQGDYIYVRP